MTFTISAVLYLLALHISVLAVPLSFSSSSFPTIATYTALGDSYASAAGTNTGSLCTPFSDAYTIQLAKTIGPVRFRSAACGGATTASVIWNQLKQIRESDLVTLTVGGNEVDFFGVLNECIYQWHPLGTCERELQRSRMLIQSSGFVEGYAKMVELGLQRLQPKGRLLVTGYATFFNDETVACDSVTFSRTDPGQFLTRKLRRELNHLVKMLNHVIRSAAEAHGAEYVDIDEIFQGHRFCEEGVSEPNNSRSDTWFFNLEYDSATAGKSEDTLRAHSQEVISAGFGRWYVDVARVFHPTKEGHAGYRDAIVKHLQFD